MGGHNWQVQRAKLTKKQTDGVKLTGVSERCLEGRLENILPYVSHIFYSCTIQSNTLEHLSVYVHFWIYFKSFINGEEGIGRRKTVAILIVYVFYYY